LISIAYEKPGGGVADGLHQAAQAVPRRTRSSSRTTALRPPIKRTAPTEETPTLPLTPVEVDALVRGASAEVVATAEASTQPTVEAPRLARGSQSLRTALASPRIKLPVARDDPPPADAAAEQGTAGQGTPATSGGETRAERGTRRPRETLHTEAIRPPNRKR
jgi:hypothetical protein